MTDNLGLNDYTIGGDFDTWGGKYVEDMATLSRFAGDALEVPDTSGNITLDVEDCSNFSFHLTGSGSSVVNLRVADTISRWWYVKNDRTDGQATVRCQAGGTAVTINPGERRLVISDGINCADLTVITLSIATITGLQAALDAKSALAGATFTGPVALAADPTTSLQAATKQYVDGLVANVGKRARARVMDTTDSDPATSGYAAGATIDGVTIVAGDLIFRNASGHQARNGMWVAPATGAAARFAEFDTFDEHPGTLIAVEEGTSGADTLWLCTSNAGGTLNTTAIVFSQVKIVQAASTSVAGIVALADNATTSTGTDANTSVTPAGLASIGPARLGVEGQTVSGGARVTVKDLGALSAAGSNTITPDPGARPHQKITNDHAGSILPGSNNGDYVLDIINATGAGALTTTGWTLKGDSFDTTTTSKFRCFASVTADAKSLHVVKLA